MSAGLIEALEQHQKDFGVDLSPQQMESLSRYYELIEKSNSLLHLVGPCSTDKFAIRHILESIFLLKVSHGCRKFADIGSGAGLPGIPCLIASPGLTGFLLESKPKKAKFLEEAVQVLGLRGRTKVINKQFEEAKNPGVDHVFCRAIDKFAKKVPALIEWSGRAVPVFLAGPAVRDKLLRLGIDHTETLIPHSERRFVFRIGKRGKGRRKFQVPGSKFQIPSF